MIKRSCNRNPLSHSIPENSLRQSSIMKKERPGGLISQLRGNCWTVGESSQLTRKHNAVVESVQRPPLSRIKLL
jgi:hypothetical protein